MSYIPTTWVDGQTPVNAENMNKLEQAVKANDTAINEINAARANGEFKGEKGDDYTLTEADRQEIAELTAELVDVPTDAHINSLINTALGVIENGTY